MANPSCYGREWDPTDPQVCPACTVEPQCRRIFASQRLDEAARELGVDSPQMLTAERLAQHCGTSVEAIEQARLARFRTERSEDPPPPSPSLPAVAPQSVTPPIESSAIPPKSSEATSEDGATTPTKRASPRRRRKPPVPTVQEPAGSSESLTPSETEPPPSVPVPEAPIGFLINITTGQVEHASWDCPPLFQPAGESAPVYQLTFWSQPLGRWVWLVAERTKRDVPEGVVELTWAQLVASGAEQKMGWSPAEALAHQVG